jgi:hypothetical protein
MEQRLIYTVSRIFGMIKNKKKLFRNVGALFEG